MAKIEELEFDDKNFNLHTEFGMSLLEKSLRENGAGRSILIDKDNRIIAGNGIVEAAGQIGLENVKIIETTGDEIIAVKRTDLSLDSKQGREMALADNATAAADLEWDTETISEFFELEDMKKWGLDLDFELEPKLKESDLSDEDFLSNYYTKKQDVEKITYEEAVTLDDRYQELEKKIDNCANEGLKEILRERLKDFKDFNFDYLADFYLSGATEEEKTLMEEFGLVIPTERSAFLNKFLDLERTILLG